jgi:hypothetical protein
MPTLIEINNPNMKYCKETEAYCPCPKCHHKPGDRIDYIAPSGKKISTVCPTKKCAF